MSLKRSKSITPLELKVGDSINQRRKLKELGNLIIKTLQSWALRGLSNLYDLLPCGEEYTFLVLRNV